jgi:hypothetical protein
VVENCPLLTQLRAQLEAEVGSTAYALAWEYGQSLDLESVVAELLAEVQPTT